MHSMVLKVDADGTKWWYLNGNFHREDGPAIELANGEKRWYLNGKRHREDGPAIEYSNGAKCWYLNGKRLNCSDNQEFLRIVKIIAIW